MLDFVESARAVLSEKDYDTIANKVLAVIRQHENRRITEYETKRVFALSRGMENGFAPISLTRLKNISLCKFGPFDNCTVYAILQSNQSERVMKEFFKLVWDFVVDYPGYSIMSVILFVVFILFTKAALEVKGNDIFFWWRCH